MSTYITHVRKDDKPVTYHEAMVEHHTRELNTIADEFLTHKENGTQMYTKLFLSKKALNTKWVLKTKTTVYGSLCYKVKLIVRGFE
jgi:hypothetical protein